MNTFATSKLSHAHSLSILNTLREYDEFMESIGTLVDLGCGSGIDLEWWASLTTRDDTPKPLNIRCTGVDQFETCDIIKKYPNATYQRMNFEDTASLQNNKYDVLWCHDAFQYCLDPLNTLIKWRNITNDNGMLILSVPKTIIVHRGKLAFHQYNSCYYHHTMISLMHMLAVTGWDCVGGFFQETVEDPCINVVVYKGMQGPLDFNSTTWYELAEQNLLPESACKSINAHGYLRQQDLVVPWLDRSVTWMEKL